ncbi:reverse transcriptase domain-containing protein [Microscilla marina]|uniref:reverse transcriptase domain-containing protein n=1 Tax=Microscilla marina TaxID=1027 RepID=UPI0018DCBBCD|nr:reverse transcriptase domain-containing protein [Microscilla marina]
MRLALHSYGFRPDRSPQDAIKAIFCGINKKSACVLDADISNCFDKINHQYLLKSSTLLPLFPAK